MEPTPGKRNRGNKTDTSVHVGMASTSGDDEDASRKAVMRVVQLWLTRLQIVSGITTFFASIDTTLLSFAIGLTRLNVLDTSMWPRTTQLLHASLAGALIFHVCAAITSFVASFVLIRYRLMDARRDLPHTSINPTINPIIMPPTPVDKPHMTRVETAPPGTHTHTRSNSMSTTGFASPLLQATHLTEIVRLFQSWSDTVTQYEDRVCIHQVQPFQWCFPRRHHRQSTGGANEPATPLEPPIRLLSNCHTLSVAMAIIGFILGLLGILTFAWTTLPLSVGIFSSACLGVCLCAIFATFTLS